MRILHIIATLDPQAGGPTESVRLLLTYGPVGYSGEVVTFDHPDAPFLRGFQFPVHALGPRNGRYGFNVRVFLWLRANRHRFDGVVVNGLWTFCGLAALLTIKGHKPYVVFTHGMLDPYFREAFPLKHVKKWLYWLPVEFWVLRGALRVLFTSTAEKESAEQSFRLHRWKPEVVPYGTRGPSGSAATLSAAFHERCPAARERRFLLYLGRIHRKKGCDLLLTAFARVAAADPDLHLVMAGPDQEGWQAELAQVAKETGCEDRVHWPGMLEGDAKWGAFHAAEAFILPSHQENFGIAVAEAMACSVPVLLSDKVNIAADIAQDGAGYTEPDTLAGTEALLRRWLATSALERQKMGTQARASFRARYDMGRNAAAIIRLFETATATQPPPTAEQLLLRPSRTA